MRMLMIATATAGIALAAAPAGAQVVTGGYGTNVQLGPNRYGGGAVYGVPSPGWGGGYVDGRWAAGTRAPGGWNAYRRPQRGWNMPSYWRNNDFRINNYAAFGLGAPPQGYGWSRYYDDAVLLDDYGRVYDSVSGVDWRRVDQPYATGYNYPGQGYYNAPSGYDDYRTGYVDDRYGPAIDPRCYRRKKGSGVGGALLGGAIGAGIGVATGGLGTALIAGGVGALGGQAIDRNSRRYRCTDGGYIADGGYPTGYVGGGYNGGGYAQGGGGGYAYSDGDSAYAQGGGGGAGGGVVYAPQQAYVQPVPPEYGYGYQGGYAQGGSASATVDFGGYAPTTTTTTTTTVTEEYISAPTVYTKVVRKPARKYVPVRRCYC